jgi:hypothetical protein
MTKASQLNISGDIDILGRVMRKRGRFTVGVLFAGDRRVADICLTLITSNPRSIVPFEMSFAWVVGEWKIWSDC